MIIEMTRELQDAIVNYWELGILSHHSFWLGDFNKLPIDQFHRYMDTFRKTSVAEGKLRDFKLDDYSIRLTRPDWAQQILNARGITSKGTEIWNRRIVNAV